MISALIRFLLCRKLPLFSCSLPAPPWRLAYVARLMNAVCHLLTWATCLFKHFQIMFSQRNAFAFWEYVSRLIHSTITECWAHVSTKTLFLSLWYLPCINETPSSMDRLFCDTLNPLDSLTTPSNKWPWRTYRQLTVCDRIVARRGPHLRCAGTIANSQQEPLNVPPHARFLQHRESKFARERSDLYPKSNIVRPLSSYNFLVDTRAEVPVVPVTRPNNFFLRS